MSTYAEVPKTIKVSIRMLIYREKHFKVVNKNKVLNSTVRLNRGLNVRKEPF